MLNAHARAPSQTLPTAAEEVLCHDSESFYPARVAKLADARDLKHDSIILPGVGKFCKTLQKKAVARSGLQANTSPSRQVLATFSATVKSARERRSCYDSQILSLERFRNYVSRCTAGKWREQMRNEFKAFPDTDRTIAMQAAYNLMCETNQRGFFVRS